MMSLKEYVEREKEREREEYKKRVSIRYNKRI
jgi:hypothetical protein